MGVKLRFAVGVATIWLAVVAGVSVTAWVAIDRAGRDVTAASASMLPTPVNGTIVTATSPGTSTPPSHGTTRPAAPTSSTGAPTPSKGAPTSAAVAPTPRDRSVSVAGGQVSVRCVGATITLRIAQPDNGWRVEVDSSDSVHVQVTFNRGLVEDGGETHVTAICSAGTPVFTVENSD